MKIIISTFAIWFLIFCYARGESITNIKKTNNLQEVFQYFDDITPETLVIFDVYKVLIIPKDKILHEEHEKILKRLTHELTKRIGNHKTQELLSLIWLQHKVKLIESSFPSIITALLEKEVKVIALTNFPTGSYGLVSSMEDLRIRTLKDYGIDFSSSFPKFPHIIFSKVKCSNTGEYACFKKGILFSCGTSKGALLEEFLNIIHKKPKHIIFVDDKYKNLESVANISKKMGIKFTGFEYTNTKDNLLHTLIEKRGKLQFDTIEMERIWLPDEEADKRLNK